MKVLVLTLCLAATGCGSHKNSEGELDSNVVDTNK